jgi:patatin-related protein
MATSEARPVKELRVGLVLYGGASLAVYMNGIVTEIWQALRASRARRDGNAAKLDGTAILYAGLLEAIAEGGDADLRIVVDAIAGTSAGGLNGAVLAKAVVDGGDAKVLNEVWIKDGDITNLRAEPAERTPWWLRWPLDACTGLIPPLKKVRQEVESLPGLDWAWARDHVYSLLVSDDGSKTVLKGSFLTEMIADTFKRMGARKGPRLLPRHGTIDLFLTRTDFHGWPRHLPVSTTFQKSPLFERTHCHWMRFSRRPLGAEGDVVQVEPVAGSAQPPVEVVGFDEPDSDFSLTYATRTTAGFPVAFAPVSYKEVVEAFEAKSGGAPFPKLDDFARRHLPEHRLAKSARVGDWVQHAWMVDGGILDNKPFTYVTDAIEQKPADHEVFRVIAYIEPDPETDIDASPAKAPAPLTIAQGLFGLFRHEPIYADLRRLDERNATVDRILAMLEAGRENAVRAAGKAGEGAGLAWPPRLEDLDRWREATNAYAAREPLSGYPGYVALKARRAVDVLAGLVCQALDYPYDARHGYFIRHLLRKWFDVKEEALAAPRYEEAGPGSQPGHVMNGQLRLLSAFDIPFRLRRLRALVRRMRPFYAKGADSVDRQALDGFKTKLARSVFAYEAELADICKDRPDGESEVRALFREVLGPDIDVEIDAAIHTVRFNADQLIAAHGDRIKSIYDKLAARFTELGDRQNAVLADAIRQLPAGAMRDAVVEEFLIFPFFDMIAFPLMDSAGIRDLISVSTMRISPHDAVALSQNPKRLKGRELGAFAGFLSRKARENDLLWGRLDGADRFIDLVVTAAALDESHMERLMAVGARFKSEVMRTILGEEAARPDTSVKDLTAQLTRDLARQHR